MTVFILGGGPAGLSIMDGLTDSQHDGFVLIERSDQLGGLARTLEWEGAGWHDLGPHKLFTLDKALMQRVLKLLPQSNWLIRKKTGGIFIKGRLLGYPPSIFQLLRTFGFWGCVTLFSGYLYAKWVQVFSNRQPENFEESLISRVGQPLYQLFYKHAATKVWGDLSLLDAKLAQNRIQVPSLLELILKQLRLQKSSTFEALDFYYPRSGLKKIWEAIAAKSARSGVVHFNQTVVKIDISAERVTAITCRDVRNDSITAFEVKETDQVVSTLPLGLLAGIMSDALPEDAVLLLKKYIVLNDLILVFFHVNQPELFGESWVYVPDPSIIFHRVSEQKSFDPDMAPNGSIVCCEIMHHAGKSDMSLSDEELVNAALRGLRAMRASAFTVLNTRVIRLPRSYPVYQTGYEDALHKILAQFDAVKNFRTVGRQGGFNYIGVMDAMDIGYGYAQWLHNQDTSWQSERLRTCNYPVLD